MESDRNIIVKVERIMGCFTTFTPINVKTRKGEPKISEALFDPKKVWETLCSKVKINKVKAVAFIINDSEFKSWSDAYDFRQKCYEYCQQNGIYYFCSSTLAFQISVGIMRSKVAIEEGEEILVIYVEGVALHGQSLIREKNYFRAVNFHLANDPNFTKKFKEVYLKGCKPKKIILLRFGNGKFIEQVVKFFKDENPIVVDVDADALNDSLIEKMLALMEKKTDGFDVPPQLQTEFVVKVDKDILITVGRANALLYEKSVIVDVASGKAVSLYSESVELVQKVKLSTFESNKVKVTLKIDSNAFYDFIVEPYDGSEEIDEEFMKLNINDVISEKSEHSQKIVRIIFGENHFCITWIPQTGCEQKILDPTGLEKIPTYIAFTAEKPVCGKSAKDMFAVAPEFVVYDLMKICSASTSESLDENGGRGW